MGISNRKGDGKRLARIIAPNVVHFPRPMSHDAVEIQAGRRRAAQAYRSARTPAEKGRALLWSAHWFRLHTHAVALRKIGWVRP